MSAGLQRYAALLRGIAPAFPNMKNVQLRGVIEGLGLDAVSSVLSSGNILFHAPDQEIATLEDRVQQALAAELGIAGGTIIRTLAELRGLVTADPFAGLAHGSSTYLTVTFLKRAAPAPAALPDLVDLPVRSVRYDEACRAYLAVVDQSHSRAAAYLEWLERTHGMDVTTRSWMTVRRIVDKLGQDH